MTREEEILNKAHQLAEKYFPDSQNIWARPNIESQKVKYACIEMAEWLEKAMIEKTCGIAKDIFENKPEMVNKEKFIEKAVKYLEANFPDIENVGGWYKESFINNFRKAMEENEL